MKDKLIKLLTSTVVLRPIFALLRKLFPILVIGKCVLATRHADVIKVLTRDTDFMIAEINQACGFLNEWLLFCACPICAGRREAPGGSRTTALFPNT